MLNSLVIMGRLTRDPELRRTNNDVDWCTFSVAVEREQRGKTDFIPCVAWRGTAQFIDKYFAKGNMICCEGRMENNPYEDKNGNKRDSWQMNVSSVHFCGSKSETGEVKAVSVEWEELDDTESLPF